MRYYLGIDPGLSGGLALIERCGDARRIVDRDRMPVIAVDGRHEYDARALCLMLSERFGDRYTVVLERQGPFPGQGVTSMFSTGYGYGLIRGLAIGLGRPLCTVSPQKWMNHVYREVGIVETCDACGTRMEGDAKPVRQRLIPQSTKTGKERRPKKVKGRWCPRCDAKLNPKDRTFDVIRTLYPQETMLATEKCSTPHSGIADAIGLATYAALVGLAAE